MFKARILLFLGTLVTILPFTGLPYSWKDLLFTLFGLALVGLSYFLYRDYRVKEKTFDNFSENGDFDRREVDNDNKTHIGADMRFDRE